MIRNSIISNENLTIIVLCLILLYLILDKCKLNETLNSLSKNKMFYYINSSDHTESKILNKINSKELRNNTIIQQIINENLFDTHKHIWQEHKKSQLPYILVTKDKLPDDNILNEIDTIMNNLELGTADIIFINVTNKKKNNEIVDYNDVLPNEYSAYNLKDKVFRNLIRNKKTNMSRSYILTLNGALNLIHKSDTMVGKKSIEDFIYLHSNREKTFILESNN